MQVGALGFFADIEHIPSLSLLMYEADSMKQALVQQCVAHEPWLKGANKRTIKLNIDHKRTRVGLANILVSVFSSKPFTFACSSSFMSACTTLISFFPLASYRNLHKAAHRMEKSWDS